MYRVLFETKINTEEGIIIIIIYVMKKGKGRKHLLLRIHNGQQYILLWVTAKLEGETSKGIA
jgi:hypothetical protein